MYTFHQKVITFKGENFRTIFN